MSIVREVRGDYCRVIIRGGSNGEVSISRNNKTSCGKTWHCTFSSRQIMGSSFSLSNRTDSLIYKNFSRVWISARRQCQRSKYFVKINFYGWYERDTLTTTTRPTQCGSKPNSTMPCQVAAAVLHFYIISHFWQSYYRRSRYLNLCTLHGSNL